jgi:phospholipid-binding lipoprotein MlaA
LSKVAASGRLVAALLIAAGLSACAGGGGEHTLPKPEFLAAPDQPGDPAEPKEIADPYETSNRATFESNQQFNRDVIYPVANAYTESVPEEVRDRISAFTSNLGEPVVFANNLLQLRVGAAATTLGRFAVNSTVGLGGLFDVAATQELNKQSGDFGQTLYVWGVRESPYLVLPVVGPTNVRDAVGSTVDFVVQIPAMGLLPASIATTAANVSTVGTVATPIASLGKVQDLQMLEESSLDFYAMLRSVSDQKRQAELQEAIATSAFTAPPAPVDPNAIEPVMTLMSSPAWAEKRPALASANAKVAAEPQSVVTVGVPTLEQ